MKHKAFSNLQASKTLLEAELVDPAMSRLYYSLFQAGVHVMAVLGRRPEDFRAGARRWTHATICGNATLFRRRYDDLRLFREARGLRERADYQALALRRPQVELLVPEVERFLKEVCP